MPHADGLTHLALAFLGLASVALCWWSYLTARTERRLVDKVMMITLALMSGGTAYLIWGIL